MSDGPCLTAVNSALYGDAPRMYSLQAYVGGINPDNEYSRDARINEPLGAWRDCMAAAGYEYADPFEPVDEWMATTPGDPPRRTATAAEIDTAVTDVGCKQTSGLTDLGLQLRDAYSREALAAADPALVAEYEAAWDRTLANAAAYESGELIGPWRAQPSDAAPRNTAACTWVVTAGADLSPGERAEYARYVDEIDLAADRPDAGPDDPVALLPPPWLLDAGTCSADPWS